MAEAIAGICLFLCAIIASIVGTVCILAGYVYGFGLSVQSWPSLLGFLFLAFLAKVVSQVCLEGLKALNRS